MLNRGDKLAHYTIESLLGSGGMGAVYLAVDSRLHRRVALKVILDSDKPEEVKESAARLLREARSAASLTHPNIVGVFDVGEIDGRVYLAMEYVVGKTMRELMRDDAIPWQRRLRWLVEVARALGAAHREGLVHRDIKPENVMVRDDGLVKVLDFGIARRTAAGIVDPTGKTEQAHIHTLTGKGLVIGTPMYMAPEQLKGGEPDVRTDQFSWGVMSYEVLSGERPWPEKSDLLAAVATILTEEPTSIRKHAPDLPPAIESAVARTLARNPDDRFESMDEIAELLEPLAVRSGPTVSRALSKSPTTRGPSRVSVRDLPKEEKPEEKEERRSTKQAMVTAKSPEHPMAPPPQEKPSWFSVRRRWAFALGIAVMGAVSLVVYKYRKPTVVVAPSPTDSQTTPPPPSAAVAPTENAEALAAYQEGVQQWRDGSARRSHASLDGAIKKDPAFAAAHLELAVQALVTGDGPARAQMHYQKAFLHRDRLSARDADVLASIEPLVRMPADLGAAEKKLVEASAKFRREAIFEYLLGYVRESRLEFEEAKKAYEQASARDAQFMPALLAKGRVLVLLGNPKDALEAFGKCIQASAAAAMCLEQRILLLRDQGDCDAMEQDARAWQNIEPEAPDPSYQLAAALMARGAPIQSVEVALKQSWNARKEDRADNEAEDTANIRLAQGDFAGAERATADWDAARPGQEVVMHSGPQQQLAFIAYEEGDVQKAARIADNFMKILPALTPSPVGNDPTIWTAEYMFRAGRITKQDLDDKRKTWLKEREANRTQQENMRLAPFRWAQLYAGFAETLDEAKDALAKQDDFLPLPPESRRTSSFDAELGKTFALAGKNDDALPPLRHVTKACIALGQPILQTRSFYFLGMALENKGDLEGAKKAYQVVVDRWGNAKPKSVTAEAAKKRLKVLE
jgi:serine/threonine protein kinase/tetratricopeptide (TPR) repeat protein